MIYWFFGYPGVGKDYCAMKLAQICNISHIDADEYLTDREKKKLVEGKFTTKDRLIKLKRIVIDLQSINSFNSFTIGDSLPDNASREFVLNSLGENVKLIHVTSPSYLHKKRMKRRKKHFFTLDLLDSYISNNWEDIEVRHLEFNNIPSKDWEERLFALVSI